MFYSQFILAKKGPLGTIWIAAHLERKLRKNQVADTDIGVSVDSILFPEVPIALRLSSHLLLGVVRIYSRKVNYLFHDCSEALLKIKQAFRSTAVDLPPEESTAPYHSITLPETFHLDDFELPDSAFQGDFVDHHVSTKEQITLQDTVDGMGFSSMQFGSDERFGDGIGSQIGLDLDEDLFLDKHPLHQHGSAAVGSDGRVLHQGQSSSSVPLTEMDADKDQRGLIMDTDVETPTDLFKLSNYHDSHIHSNIEVMEKNDVSPHWHDYNIQTPNLNKVFSSNDHNEDQIGHTSIADVPNPESTYCAHAPSTPGLIEEAVLTLVPESPALSPQHKHSPSFGTEALKTDNGLQHASMVEPESAHVAQVVSSPTVLLEETQQIAAPDEPCEWESTENFQIKFVSGEAEDLSCKGQNLDNGENTLPEVAQMEGLVSSRCSLEASNSEVPLDKSLVKNEVVTETSKVFTENLLAPSVTSAINGSSLRVEAQPSSNQDLEVVDNSCLKSSRSALSSDFHLRSTSESNQANTLSAEKGEFVQDAPDISLEDPCVPSEMPVKEKALEKQGTSLTEIFPGSGNTKEQSVDPLSKDVELDQLNCSSSPEKMLLASTGDVNQAKELSQLTVEKGVAESDGSVDRITTLSGRKHHLMDSASEFPNGSSAKMSGRKSFRRSTDSIPDDDDLLASILVGKRTPLLKIGPTPPPPKATSLKRHRATSRSGMWKGLLDETTVLHADAIRRQLMNTEDIRRIRRKAPCTRPEIWMIQKSSAEDEIFNEPVTTGMSEELSALHSQRYGYEVNQLNSCVEPLEEFNYSRSSDIIRVAGGKETAEPIVPDNIGFGGQESPGLSVLTKAGSSKVTDNCDAHEHLPSLTDLPQLEALGNNTPCTVATADMIVKERNADVSLPIASYCSHNNASVFSKENNDACMHPGQQTLHGFVQTTGYLSQTNDTSLHLIKAPVEGLAISENDPGGGIVDKNVPAILDNDTLIQVEVECAATDASIMEEKSSVDVVIPSVSQDVCSAEENEHSHSLVSTLDSCLPQVDENFPKGTSTVILGASSCQDVIMESGESSDKAITEREGQLGTKVEDEAIAQIILDNKENAIPDISFSERSDMASVSSLPSAVGEISSLQEFNLAGGVDIGSPMDFATVKECSDFCSAIDGNGTEFLNADDETDYNEEADDAPNPEEAQSLENSGWSSRTRGVGRYLRNLFVVESGRGRKDIAMDHLIAGKTRKEASRMFFETLVLTTKDYIRVEQASPFSYVNIEPRAKLLKSEF